MLSDSFVHALFADSPENSPKKEKHKQKTKSKKGRAKIEFDPSIFDQNNEEPINFNNDYNDFILPSNNSTMLPIELTNFISNITLYLNCRINYLKDDFMNQLLLLINTSKNEEMIINSFLNDIIPSIKQSIILYDEHSNWISGAFTPNQFDIYSQQYHKIFSEAKEFSKTYFDTSSIKSLRNAINSSYHNIKQDLMPLPQQIQSETLDLSIIYQNYQTIYESYEIHTQSRKKRKIALECKRIEQEILSETNSNQIETLKEEKAQFALIMERSEQNQEITSAKIEDLIQSLKNTIITKYKGSRNQLNEQHDQIRNAKKELKVLRAKLSYLEQAQITVGLSNISIEQDQMQLNQSNTVFPINGNMNMTYAYGDVGNQNTNNMKKKARDFYDKVRKGLNALMKEQSRNLENTSAYLKSIQDANRSEIVDRLRNSFYA